MEKDRLLTEQEWSEACAAMPGGSKCSDCRVALCAKQDTKTAAQVQAATLRAVGEALRRLHPVGGPSCLLLKDEIEALLRGETPAGWERK